jgi:hypothetical protein
LTRMTHNGPRPEHSQQHLNSRTIQVSPKDRLTLYRQAGDAANRGREEAFVLDIRRRD